MKIFVQLVVIGLLFLFATPTSCGAQVKTKEICENPKFDKKVASTLSHTVDFISPKQLSTIKKEAFVLDTREQEEYNISHIPDAHYVSYSDFNIDPFLELPRDTTIIVYCSIGYRSEKIGEKLQKAGFTKVYNLYGSLFEWANQGYPMVNADGAATNRVHTYNKKWSQWVDDDGTLEKIW